MRSKKGSRKIVVGNVEYRWKATGNDGYILISIWPTNTTGPNIICNIRYHETWIDKGYGSWSSAGNQIIVTNRLINRIIELAMTEHGYEPQLRGTELNLGSIDEAINWDDAVRGGQPMSEAEWLTGYYSQRMYNVIRNQITIRQVRLFMVACCRLMEAEFFDPRIPIALQLAEQCADDPHSEATVDAIGFEMATHPNPRLPEVGFEGEIARVVKDVYNLINEWWDRTNYRNVQQAIAHSVYMSLREKPREVFTGGQGNAAEYVAHIINVAELLRTGDSPQEMDLDGPETETGIQRAIANQLRDIIGNPFRPAVVDPAWLTSTITALAQQMYDSRDFSTMPILADALEDAGCDNADILAHCRQPGNHVKGCWVVDAVLGRK